MIELSFKQTSSELMVRASATILFNSILRHGFPLKPLSKLAEGTQYGFTASATQDIEGIKFVRITDLKDGKINWDTVPYCKCDSPDQYILENGDILFARTGATTGKTHLVKESPKAVFASYLIRLRPKKNIIADYLYYFFQSDIYWKQIIEEKEGSAQPNVNGKKLIKINIPLVPYELQVAISSFLEVVRLRQDGIKKELPELPPPLEEQRRIVARIEELETAIAEARGLRKQSIEEVSLLFPTSMESIFDSLSNEFQTQRIETLCEVVRGGSPRPAGSPLYYGGDIPFFKVGDLTKDTCKYVYDAVATVNEEGRKRSRYIPENTLMLTNSGATLGVPKITKIAGCFNDGSQAFLQLNTSIDQEYLYYYFLSKTNPLS